MKTCTFAGHREVYAAGISERVDAAIESILRADTDFTFYAGDMGAFDFERIAPTGSAMAFADFLHFTSY